MNNSFETDADLNRAPGRELDKQVAIALGLVIEHESWPCYHSPDCGEYEAALSDDGDPVPFDGRRDIIYREREPEFYPGGYGTHELGFWCKPVPFFSTDIAEAWELAEAARLMIVPWGPKGWYTTSEDGESGWICPYDTAPLAICHGFLEVKRRELKKEQADG